jgi:hypothetical protein
MMDCEFESWRKIQTGHGGTNHLGKERDIMAQDPGIGYRVLATITGVKWESIRSQAEFGKFFTHKFPHRHVLNRSFPLNHEC